VLGPTLAILVGAELGKELTEGLPVGEEEGFDDKDGIRVLSVGDEVGWAELDGAKLGSEDG